MNRLYWSEDLTQSVWNVCRTLKTFCSRRNNVVLNKNNVEGEICINSESNRLEITIWLYRCYGEHEAPRSCNTTFYLSIPIHQKSIHILSSHFIYRSLPLVCLNHHPPLILLLFNIFEHMFIISFCVHYNPHLNVVQIFVF